jgi:hypothetical protein
VAYYARESADSSLILRDVGETISVTVYSGETATDADGSVTVGIVDEAGATVVAAGTSTTRTGLGEYAYTLAAQSDLKRLTVTWSGTWGTAMSFVTASEVVGAVYTTPAEVRGMSSISGETDTFTAADVVEAITYATTIIDDYAGASFVQRYHRDVLNGTSTDTIRVSAMFPETLLSATIDGTALSSSKLDEIALFEDGTLVRKSDVWTFTNPGAKVLIEYEAGASTTAPTDIRWAARTLARYHLLEQVSRIPDRAISVQSEFGQIQLAQPGMNKPSPLPDVNTVLNRHRHRGPTAF